MARDIAALVQAVKAHATEHYDEGGWDYVIETMEDADIIELIGRARTAKGAIKKVAETVDLLGERRAEIVGMGDNYDYSQDAIDAPVVEEETSDWVPPIIPIAEAKSVDALYEESEYPFVQHTDLGVVCGQCTKANRDKGDKTAVRHASAAHVRTCYTVLREAKEEAEREAAIERAAERYFEDRGASDYDPYEYQAEQGW